MSNYIHLFSTTAARDAVYNGSGYTEPWVSLVTATDEVDYNHRYEKLPYYSLAANEHVNFGILNPEGEYYTTTSDGPIYGKFGVFFHDSVDGPNVQDWGTIFTNGTKEFSLGANSQLLINGVGKSSSSGTNARYSDYIYAFQCNKDSQNYNNAMWVKSASPRVSSSGVVKFEQYGSQPWNFIFKPTYLGSPIIGHTCTQRIEFVTVLFDFSSDTWTNLYPYRDKYTNEVVFMSEDGEYIYSVSRSTLTEWPNMVHDYVDLGLSSGTLWATCNLGAEIPEEYGDYFAWAETTSKSYFIWSNYAYGSSSSNLTKYNSTDGKTLLDLTDDAARVNWGGLWTTPTLVQIQELINDCTWTENTLNGVQGYTVSGNNNSIFIPKSGNIQSSSHYGWSQQGWYWSNTVDSSKGYGVCLNGQSTNTKYRYCGLTIRPVILPS